MKLCYYLVCFYLLQSGIIPGMDFGQLPKSALELVSALAIAVNTSFAPALPPPSETGLIHPSLISSYNLPAEIISPNQNSQQQQSIESGSSDGVNLVLVTKEPVPIEVATVEQPVIYTVTEPEKPVKKSSASDEENSEPKIEIIKEVKAEEPSPSPVSTPTPVPSQTPATSSSGNSNSEKLFQMVNDYRTGMGLPAFEKDERLCKIAQERAPQINAELNSGNLHKGFKDLNLSYWATENIAAYSSIEENLKFWLSDYIHKKAIESSNKYSCVACTGSSCSQIFTSFVEK